MYLLTYLLTQRVKIYIIAWIILKSQIFVEPVNQKSDGSISFCSSSSVSAQRISLDGRSVNRTGLAHFQGMDFKRPRLRKSVAQFDIFLLQSSLMSESFSCLDYCWKTWHLRLSNGGIFFSFSRSTLKKSQRKFTFSDSGPSGCQYGPWHCFVDLMLLWVWTHLSQSETELSIH